VGEEEHMTNEARMIKAKINSLALDVSTNSPVVVLSPEDSEKILPIWIGHYEAWAIAMELSGIASKRPLTHDLVKAVVGSLGGKIQKVEVTDLVSQTFYAKIYIERNGSVLTVDARPSDSIALALKSKAPIFVNETLFQEKKEETGERPEGESPDSLRERLRRINPEDFGKYSLG
jgi:hypothetical protein